MTGKNMRLLGREDSPNRQPSIQETMRELHEEIERGETVYTVAELQLLERKRAEYEQLLQNLLSA